MGREVADKNLPVLRVAPPEPEPETTIIEAHSIAPSAIPVAAIGPADEPEVSLVEHTAIAQLVQSGDRGNQSTLITNPFGSFL